MNVSGLNELQAALNQLGGKYAQDAAKRALNDAAKEPAKAMRRSIPKKSGNARKSIRIRMRMASSGVPVAYVGSFGRRAWYVRLLEHGTKPARTNVYETSRGRRRSKPKRMKFNGRFATARNHPGIAAGNFLGNAFEGSVRPALDKLKQRLREQIVVQAFKKSKVS